jgi:DNA gyrase/topoisomerase IV subunit B
MSEERANKIKTHNIKTNMLYMVKKDIMETSFKMEIETKWYLDNTSIASIVIPYIKEQLKNHLKMELSEDMKAYKKAIRRMLKRIKEDEESYGYSNLNNRLVIESETREVSKEYYDSIQIRPFHNDNIVRPLTWNERNLSEDQRRRRLMEELNA